MSILLTDTYHSSSCVYAGPEDTDVKKTRSLSSYMRIKLNVNIYKTQCLTLELLNKFVLLLKLLLPLWSD